MSTWPVFRGFKVKTVRVHSVATVAAELHLNLVKCAFLKLDPCDLAGAGFETGATERAQMCPPVADVGVPGIFFSPPLELLLAHIIPPSDIVTQRKKDI